jgi:Cu+-exporting ATPase
VDEKNRQALITIPITGMSCASCANRVEKGLSKTAGVSEANVNFAAEKATVAYDPEAVSLEELLEAVEDAGYDADVQETTFDVSGMSCASCVGRVEKALGRVPGVIDVNVNLATERATVKYLASEAEDKDFARAIEGAGYGVARQEGADAAEGTHRREYDKLRGNFLVAAVLTALILIGSLPHMFGFMLPVPMMWLKVGLLALATPVQFWAGWRFYEGAWALSSTDKRT